ncbi:MAG: hypothetical protein K2H41_03615 [Acetatifactor sp.]|nr:hypothetical protein [Acetatifactor sp.]
MFARHRKKWIAALLSFILTILQIGGWQLSMKYGTSIHHSDFFLRIGMLNLYQCIGLGIVEFILLGFLIYWGFDKLEKRAAAPGASSPGEIKHLWLYTSIALYIIYVLCLLGCYPGFYCYDMGIQLPQIMYAEVPFDAHHPLLHTIVGGGLITIGHSLYPEDLTFGVFLYNLVQMGICALCFGHAVRFVYRLTGKRALTIFSFLFYALCPPVVLFAMATTKDVVCYAVLLTACVKQYELYRALTDGRKVSLAQWTGSCILLCLACLLRKNIVYAIVVFAVFAAVLLRKHWRSLLLLYLVAVLAYTGINKGMITILGARESSAAEAMSIPFQQLARLYDEKGEAAFPGEDLDLLYNAIDPRMLDSYDPLIADPIKTAFWYHLDTIMENKGDYLSLWIRKGLEYPGIYIASFAANTYQAWYPWTELMDSYRYRYFDISDWMVEYCRPLCPPLYDFYQGIMNGSYRSYPVVRLLFSTGTMFVTMLIALFYAIRQKNRPATLTLLLEFLVCATCLCGPVADLRYYLILFYMFPASLGFLLQPDK